HDHDRSTAAARSRPMLVVTLALTGVMMVVEFVAGLWTGSLALLADAGHMLTDATALALALIAAWLAARPPTPAKTYGYYRAEILAALAAAGIMVSTGWTGADPLASALIVLLILPRTWSLLRQAVNVLLEGTPAHLSLGEIEAAITRVTGVRRVHDLHVWTLTSGRE